MATQSWSSRIRHDSDAFYREWRDELMTKLNLLVGADKLGAAETNITPGAGARPAVNTYSEYAIFYLNDSLHATAPVYFKLSVGTGSTTSSPRLVVTLGTATNGSGTLSGAAPAAQFINGTASSSSDTSRQSYACAIPGFFGLSYKEGVNNHASFLLCRSCASDGSISADGSVSHFGASSANNINLRASVRYGDTPGVVCSNDGISTASFGAAPTGMVNSALGGGDVQAILGWMAVPQIRPIFGLVGVFPAELAPGGTFSAIPVGSTPRTFITLASTAGPFTSVSASSVGGLHTAMLWE